MKPTIEFEPHQPETQREEAGTGETDEEINYFGYGEKDFFRNWAEARTRFFRPLCQWLTKRGITADHVTIAGLVPMLLFFFPLFYLDLKYVAYVFLGLNIIMDAIDGPLARIQKTAGNKGALLDMANDLTAMAVVVVTAVHFEYMNATIGIVYVISYLYMIVFAIAQNLIGDPFRFVCKSKYPFYALFILRVSYGVNWLDPFAGIMATYMVVQSIASFRILRRDLKE